MIEFAQYCLSPSPRPGSSPVVFAAFMRRTASSATSTLGRLSVAAIARAGNLFAPGLPNRHGRRGSPLARTSSSTTTSPNVPRTG